MNPTDPNQTRQRVRGIIRVNLERLNYWAQNKNHYWPSLSLEHSQAISDFIDSQGQRLNELRRALDGGKIAPASAEKIVMQMDGQIDHARGAATVHLDNLNDLERQKSTIQSEMDSHHRLSAGDKTWYEDRKAALDETITRRSEDFNDFLQRSDREIQNPFEADMSHSIGARNRIVQVLNLAGQQVTEERIAEIEANPKILDDITASNGSTRSGSDSLIQDRLIVDELQPGSKVVYKDPDGRVTTGWKIISSNQNGTYGISKVNSDGSTTVLDVDSENISIPSKDLTISYEDGQKALEDLRTVGPSKPLGNMPISSIERMPEVNIDSLENELKSKGLKVVRFGESANARPALAVYDEAALKNLLEQNGEILTRAGWPSDPVEFVNRVHSETAPSNTPLFNVVADAFGDRVNPGRTPGGAPGSVGRNDFGNRPPDEKVNYARAQVLDRESGVSSSEPRDLPTSGGSSNGATTSTIPSETQKNLAEVEERLRQIDATFKREGVTEKNNHLLLERNDLIDHRESLIAEGGQSSADFKSNYELLAEKDADNLTEAAGRGEEVKEKLPSIADEGRVITPGHAEDIIRQKLRQPVGDFDPESVEHLPQIAGGFNRITLGTPPSGVQFSVSNTDYPLGDLYNDELRSQLAAISKNRASLDIATNKEASDWLDTSESKIYEELQARGVDFRNGQPYFGSGERDLIADEFVDTPSETSTTGKTKVKISAQGSGDSSSSVRRFSMPSNKGSENIRAVSGVDTMSTVNDLLLQHEAILSDPALTDQEGLELTKPIDAKLRSLANELKAQGIDTTELDQHLREMNILRDGGQMVSKPDPAITSSSGAKDLSGEVDPRLVAPPSVEGTKAVYLRDGKVWVRIPELRSGQATTSINSPQSLANDGTTTPPQAPKRPLAKLAEAESRARSASTQEVSTAEPKTRPLSKLAETENRVRNASAKRLSKPVPTQGTTTTEPPHPEPKAIEPQSTKPTLTKAKLSATSADDWGFGEWQDPKVKASSSAALMSDSHVKTSTQAGTSTNEHLTWAGSRANGENSRLHSATGSNTGAGFSQGSQTSSSFTGASDKSGGARKVGAKAKRILWDDNKQYNSLSEWAKGTKIASAAGKAITTAAAKEDGSLGSKAAGAAVKYGPDVVKKGGKFVPYVGLAVMGEEFLRDPGNITKPGKINVSGTQVVTGDANPNYQKQVKTALFKGEGPGWQDVKDKTGMTIGYARYLYDEKGKKSGSEFYSMQDNQFHQKGEGSAYNTPQAGDAKLFKELYPVANNPAKPKAGAEEVLIKGLKADHTTPTTKTTSDSTNQQKHTANNTVSTDTKYQKHSDLTFTAEGSVKKKATLAYFTAGKHKGEWGVVQQGGSGDVPYVSGTKSEVEKWLKDRQGSTTPITAAKKPAAAKPVAMTSIPTPPPVPVPKTKKVVSWEPEKPHNGSTAIISRTVTVEKQVPKPSANPFAGTPPARNNGHWVYEGNGVWWRMSDKPLNGVYQRFEIYTVPPAGLQLTTEKHTTTESVTAKYEDGRWVDSQTGKALSFTESSEAGAAWQKQGHLEPVYHTVTIKPPTGGSLPAAVTPRIQPRPGVPPDDDSTSPRVTVIKKTARTPKRQTPASAVGSRGGSNPGIHDDDSHDPVKSVSKKAKAANQQARETIPTYTHMPGAGDNLEVSPKKLHTSKPAKETVASTAHVDPWAINLLKDATKPKSKAQSDTPKAKKPPTSTSLGSMDSWAVNAVDKAEKANNKAAAPPSYKHMPGAGQLADTVEIGGDPENANQKTYAWHASSLWTAPNQSDVSTARLDSAKVLEQRPSDDNTKIIFRINDGTYKSYNLKTGDVINAGTWNASQWDESGFGKPAASAYQSTQSTWTPTSVGGQEEEAALNASNQYNSTLGAAISPNSQYSTKVDYDNDLDAAAQVGSSLPSQPTTNLPQSIPQPYVPTTPVQPLPSVPTNNDYYDYDVPAANQITLPTPTPYDSPSHPLAAFDSTQAFSRFGHTPTE